MSEQSLPAEELDPQITDSCLIKRCLQGDKHSFSLLYKRYQQKVRSTLYRFGTNSNLDDLVQEVFIRVWKGLPRLRQTTHFSTWLYRITWNVATDEQRRWHQLYTQKQALSQNLQVISLSSQIEDMHYQDLVQRSLQTLSFDHRCVLVLHDLEERPQKEIAEILGIPVGTVKSRLYHARSYMRDYLKQQGLEL
ncbi:RNA polymerase subunit sigma [Merismopedia glauca CCAP 1448/3]|uniref:RNA polymerase subunit sigma n=1 Tax=Merismopedia glauca CCAP 1448/3 TaxID=1296344 RepID=A0A2T1C4C8_9CYAN|nr:sigma-70 family RNA polymerase sigma factor [Merismopedia glauca]PSB03101.1 RNA polymerase subunit sigma [Merismopedia glauca CCAP 1448/3]